MWTKPSPDNNFVVKHTFYAYLFSQQVIVCNVLTLFLDFILSDSSNGKRENAEGEHNNPSRQKNETVTTDKTAIVAAFEAEAES